MEDKRVFDELGLVLESKSTYNTDKEFKSFDTSLVSMLLNCIGNTLFLDYKSLLDFLCRKEIYYSKNIVRDYLLEVFSEDRVFDSRREPVKGLIKKIENEAEQTLKQI